jgi:hypothetical protein
MPNSTVPAAATGLPEKEKRDAEELKAARLHFEQLYLNWLTARCDRTNPSLPDDNEAANARSDREDEAARSLFITPSLQPWMVWRKFEAFEFYFCDPDGGFVWGTDVKSLSWAASRRIWPSLASERRTMNDQNSRHPVFDAISDMETDFHRAIGIAHALYWLIGEEVDEHNPQKHEAMLSVCIVATETIERVKEKWNRVFHLAAKL